MRLNPTLSLVTAILMISAFAARAQNSVSIGTVNTDPNAVLWLVGVNQGLILPITNDITTMPKKAGMVVFSAGKVYSCDGAAWTAIGAGGGGSQTLSLIGNNLSISGAGGNQIPLAASPATSQFYMFDGTNWVAKSLSQDVLNTMGVITVSGLKGKPLPASFAAGVLTSDANGVLSWTTPSGTVPTIPANQILSSTASTSNVPVTVAGDLGLSVTGSTGTFSIANNATAGANIINSANSATSATINGARVNPAFGAQNILTTGTISGGATTVTGLTVSGTTTTINTKAYVWPSTAASANSYLKNDGLGNLSWATLTGGGNMSTTTYDTNSDGIVDGAASLTTTLPLSKGGTGITITPTANQVLTTNGSSTVGWTNISALPSGPVLSATQILTGNGTTNAATVLSGDATINAGSLVVTGLIGKPLPPLPVTLQYLAWDGTTLTWKLQTPAGGGDMTKATYDSNADGIISAANGGTGLSTTPANGQLLIGNGTGYTLSTLTPGTGINVTNSAGGISISSTGLSNPMTAPNQMIFGGAAGAPTALTAPTANQILTSNGTSAPTWVSSIGGGQVTPSFGAQAISTTGTLSSGATTVTGLTVSGTTTTINTKPYVWSSAAAAANSYLKNDGAGNLSWATLTGGGNMSTTTYDTNSDGIVDAAASLTTTLPLTKGGTGIIIVPTANQILTTNGTSTPTWANSIAGSQVTPSFGAQAISTTGTLSSGATTVTGLTVSGATTSLNNKTYTWPNNPTLVAGTFLQTDATGNLSWAPVTGSLPVLTNNQLFSNNGVTNLGVTVGGDLTYSVVGTTGSFVIGGTAATGNNIVTAINASSSTINSSKLGTVAIAQGGTGATTAAAALTNLGALSNPMNAAGDLIYGGVSGVPTKLATGTGFLKGGATPAYSAINLASTDVSGALPIANGGTGATTVAAAQTNLGLGSLATLSAVSGGAAGTITDATIVNADIAAAAAIADTKLATISTAGKVSGSAITSGTIGGSTIINTSGDISTTGKLSVTGTTSFGTKTYTWPSTALVASTLLTTDAAGNLSWVNSPVAFSTSNVIPKGNGTGLTSSLIYDDGTHVGVGTTTPSTELQVDGNYPSIRIRSKDASTISQAWVEFGHDDGSGGFTKVGQIGDNGSSDNLYLFSPNYITFNSNFADRFAIGTSGELGAGSPVSFGSAGDVLTSGGSGATAKWKALPATFSTANSIPKGDGTTMVSSSLTDNGTQVTASLVNATGPAFYLSNNGGNPGLSGRMGLSLGANASAGENVFGIALNSNTSGAGNNDAIFAIANGSTSRTRGVTAGAYSGTSSNYGVDSYASGSGSSSNYGLNTNVNGGASNYGVFNNVTGGTSTAYGIYNNISGANAYGIYSAGETYNYFNGSVGIGQPTPTTRLHVLGSNTFITVEESATSNSGIKFVRAGGNKWLFHNNYGSPGDNLSVYDYSTGKTPFQINQGGFVSIGGATSAIGSSTFVVQDDNGAGSFGGMYISTHATSGTNTTGLPFYGYSNGSGTCYTYMDGNNSNMWRHSYGVTLTSGGVFYAPTLTKGAGTFKIDHPQDPENKFLSHSFVESPDMMNVYNGNITTGENNEAVVELPNYFGSLNKDFRYQLTVIGTFAQAIVFKKIENNKFVIKTDKPNVEVSWQVTGIRKDPFAEQNRVVPETEKSSIEKGKYLNPEAYGLPKSKGINYTEPKQ